MIGIKVLLAIVLIYSVPSYGTVFKCVDSSGDVIYSDTACGKQADRQVVELSTQQETSARPSFLFAFTEKLKNFFKGLADKSNTRSEKPDNLKQISQQHFRCDGRTRCSQMTSCEEATFFINHCPNTEMDGDSDGVPCESQWCR